MQARVLVRHLAPHRFAIGAAARMGGSPPDRRGHRRRARPAREGRGRGPRMVCPSFTRPAPSAAGPTEAGAHGASRPDDARKQSVGQHRLRRVGSQQLSSAGGQFDPGRLLVLFLLPESGWSSGFVSWFPPFGRAVLLRFGESVFAPKAVRTRLPPPEIGTPLDAILPDRAGWPARTASRHCNGARSDRDCQRPAATSDQFRSGAFGMLTAATASRLRPGLQVSRASSGASDRTPVPPEIEGCQACSDSAEGRISSASVAFVMAISDSRCGSRAPPPGAKARPGPVLPYGITSTEGGPECLAYCATSPPRQRGRRVTLRTGGSSPTHGVQPERNMCAQGDC